MRAAEPSPSKRASSGSGAGLRPLSGGGCGSRIASVRPPDAAVPWLASPGMRRTLVGVALVLLVACGGDSEPETVQSLAEKLGCTRTLVIEDDDKQRELGAREEGACQLGAESVTVLVYNTNTARDTSNKIAKEFGGIAVLGDRWTVRVDSQATAERVREKLGGKID